MRVQPSSLSKGTLKTLVDKQAGEVPWSWFVDGSLFVWCLLVCLLIFRLVGRLVWLLASSVTQAFSCGRETHPLLGFQSTSDLPYMLRPIIMLSDTGLLFVPTLYATGNYRVRTASRLHKSLHWLGASKADNSETNWETLSKHTNDASLNGPFACHAFPITSCNNSHRYVSRCIWWASWLSCRFGVSVLASHACLIIGRF